MTTIALILYIFGICNMWLNLSEGGEATVTGRGWVGCFVWPVLIAVWVIMVAIEFLLIVVGRR